MHGNGQITAIQRLNLFISASLEVLCGFSRLHLSLSSGGFHGLVTFSPVCCLFVFALFFILYMRSLTPFFYSA